MGKHYLVFLFKEKLGSNCGLVKKSWAELVKFLKLQFEFRRIKKQTLIFKRTSSRKFNLVCMLRSKKISNLITDIVHAKINSFTLKNVGLVLSWNCQVTSVLKLNKRELISCVKENYLWKTKYLIISFQKFYNVFAQNIRFLLFNSLTVELQKNMTQFKNSNNHELKTQLNRINRLRPGIVSQLISSSFLWWMQWNRVHSCQW